MSTLIIYTNGKKETIRKWNCLKIQKCLRNWLKVILLGCLDVSGCFNKVKLEAPKDDKYHSLKRMKNEPFYAKTYNLVKIFDLYSFVQKIFSCFTWPLSEILVSRAGDLQRYDVINTSGVNFMSRCYMNFHCKR